MAQLLHYLAVAVSLVLVTGGRAERFGGGYDVTMTGIITTAFKMTLCASKPINPKKISLSIPSLLDPIRCLLPQPRTQILHRPVQPPADFRHPSKDLLPCPRHRRLQLILRRLKLSPKLCLQPLQPRRQVLCAGGKAVEVGIVEAGVGLLQRNLVGGMKLFEGSICEATDIR
jgi:hypothetical protein